MLTLELKDLKTVEKQNWLQHAIAPRPIAFASTISKEGNVNLSPFSFFNMFSTDPPIIIFSPSRRVRDNTTKHTLQNVLEIPEVVINICDYNMVQQLSLTSCDYPKEVDEFIKAGFTKQTALHIKPPMVKEAKVKLEPVPMYAFRDSAVTMYQHNLIIEGQRKLRKGLIAGIKKDVVIIEKLSRDSKPNRVAIYGWQKPDGKPIQPLYIGHVNWYVDYSHGIRLVYRTIFVNKKPMDYIDVLKDKNLRRLLCDEEYCDCYRYDTADSVNVSAK